MPRETQEVSLGDLLRYVFESDDGAHGAPRAVPVTRTSIDRSRMREKVLDELARRRKHASGSADTDADAPGSSAVSEDGLFVRPDHSVIGCARGKAVSCLVAAPRRSTCAKSDLRDLVAVAYRSLFRRLPEDHVVLDPRANAEFVVRCRDLGATVTETVLNRTLLNNRKASLHAGVVRVSPPILSRRTVDRVGHAVEIAASLVQHECVMMGHTMPSVDDIICSPELRNAFSSYASAMSCGIDTVESLLVLLAFRKSGRESAVRLANTDMPDRTLFAPLRSLDPDEVPARCGIYRVLQKRRPVFVSGTSDLRKRIRDHLESGHDKFLPESIPFEIDSALSVEVYAARWTPRRAEAVARSMRIEDYPDLNWREKGCLFNQHSSIVHRQAQAV